MPTTVSILTSLLPAALAAGSLLAATLATPAIGSVEPLTYDSDTARFLNPEGRAVSLRGVNLGNWFLLEPWMLALDTQRYRDQHDILTTLRQRFGDEAAQAFLDTYRENWITARELQHAKVFGFNVVRLPFHYSLLLEYERPYAMKDDPFRWLDHAIRLCETQGLHVILDLHGAPGGQSHDMPSGRVGENDLWTDEIAQQQMIALWRAVAQRYADHPAVIGYDLVNEPWGDFQQDLRADITRLVDRLHDAIREVDPDTVLYAPGLLNGVLFYGDPRDRGWTRTGLTIHTYPGLFGNGEPTLATHQRFLEQEMPALAAEVARLRVPMLVGEFNPVFAEVDRPAMLRRHFDTFARLGWHATLWSLRKINPEGGLNASDWCLLTNAQPFRLPDPATASAVELDQAFEALGAQPLDVDPYLLQDPLTTAYVDELGIPQPPQAAAEPTLPPGWSAQAIGDDARISLIQLNDNQTLTMHARGQDIWAGSDRFAFLHRPAQTTDELALIIDDFDAVGRYGKAGVMLRADDSPEAPHVLLHIFRNGNVVLAHRAQAGGPTREQLIALGKLPVGLAIRRDDGRISWRTGSPESGWDAWQILDAVTLDDHARLGVALSSNHEAGDARLNARLTRDLTPTNPPNRRAIDLATPDWNSWGSGLKYESDTNSLVYNTGKSTPGSAGVFRDLPNLGEGTVTLRVRPRGYKNLHDTGSLELRLEIVEEDGRILRLATTSIPISEMQQAQAVHVVHTSGNITTGQNVRALFVVDGIAAPTDASLSLEQPELIFTPARRR